MKTNLFKKYVVKKGSHYLYKIKDNGYGYFSERIRAKLFSKREAEKYADRYNAEVEEA